MQKNYTLEEVGPAISQYIKDHPDHQIQDVAWKVLKIHPTNATRRMKSNSLKFNELGAIATYLGLEVTLTVGEMKFTNNGNLLNDPMALIEYQEKYISVLEENRKLSQQISELKEKNEPAKND